MLIGCRYGIALACELVPVPSLPLAVAGIHGTVLHVLLRFLDNDDDHEIDFWLARMREPALHPSQGTVLISAFASAAFRNQACDRELTLRHWSLVKLDAK